MTRSRPLAVLLAATAILLALVVPLLHAKPHGRPSGWTAFDGAWSESPKHIDNSSEERGAKYIQSAVHDDYTLEADIRIAELDGEGGIILRSRDEEAGVDAFRGYYAGVRTADATLEFGRDDFSWNPLARISLPTNVDLQRGFHLRVSARGCDFAVEVDFPDGRRSAIVQQDPGCALSGHSGLRSTRSAVTWTNLRFGTAPSDFASLRALAAESPRLPLTQPYNTAHAAFYESSLRAVAQKRALQAGVEPILDFLMLPGRHPNVTLQGAVISLPPLVAIQDDTNALIVPNVHSQTPLKLGDIVIAHGTVVSERFRSSLEDADIRVLWSDLPVPPLAVTAAQLTGGQYRGRYIALEGTLLSASDHNGAQELVLRDGGLLFRGVSTQQYRIDPARFEAGSRLRLYGLATSLDEFTKGTYPFAVLVHQVDVVSAPPWWSPRHIALVAAAAALLILLLQLAFHRVQQWQIRSMVQQREQLAFEMHDTLAQSFTGIAYQLNAARLERRGEEKVQAHISHALEMAQMSHREASRTIAALRPQLRDAGTLVEALRQSALRLADGGDLQVTTSIEGRTAALPVAVTDAFYRIGQEAISNAIQHGNCSHLHIAFSASQREARLAISNNGDPFAVDREHAGLGLAGMKSRAEKVRGQLLIDSTERGTAITVIAPLPITAGLLQTLAAMLRSSVAPKPRNLERM